MSAFKDDHHPSNDNEDGDDNLYPHDDDDNDDDMGEYDDRDGDGLLIGGDGSNDDDEAIDLEENETDDIPRLNSHYTLLEEADIRRRIGDIIAEVSAVLSISKVEASILLLRYNWSVNKVHDAWFVDENEARQKAGLLLNPLVQLPDQGYIDCGICFESYPRSGIKSATCGHPYCNECWSSYIKTAIDNGMGSLLLKCPEPSCPAAVGEDMIGLFASEEEKDKYSRYLLLSYVEENKMIKWCPGPGCGKAVKYIAGSENFDVSCSCSQNFCWNCSEEAHRPVDCETVKKWMLKHSSEAENVNYILAFTKPCPKCKRPIEKNQGCAHMTCRPPCNHHFCWLCLGDLGRHHVGCNGYKEEKRVKNSDDEKRDKAKKYLERYTHYFERWATNKKSKDQAMAAFEKVKSKQIEIVGHAQGQPAGQLSFLVEAWEQIIECRKVLTWTYAYGYYLVTDEPEKKNFFEYLQGEAETGLERLHDCAEKELAPFLKHDHRSKMEFIEFRKKLTGLTTVTRNYFENLVKALENGLSDVYSSSSSSSASKKPRLDPGIVNGYAQAATETWQPQPWAHDNVGAAAATREPQPWTCSFCTYNNDALSTYCAACGRGAWPCDRCTYANLSTATTCAMCSEPRDG